MWQQVLSWRLGASSQPHGERKSPTCGNMEEKGLLPGLAGAIVEKADRRLRASQGCCANHRKREAAGQTLAASKVRLPHSKLSKRLHVNNSITTKVTAGVGGEIG